MDKIVIKGARENNLKNIDLEIPRDKLVVFTGVSGSGKSSLAFETIYAEGQRRYMESLSSYARQFLGQMEKPDVDNIEGLSPAISIDQKTTNHNPRSTVGTVTEIYDYLRLLFARVGTPHCPSCGKVIRRQTVDEIVDKLLALPEGTRVQLLAPVVRERKGEHAKVLDEARKGGYVRARVDGEILELSDEIKLEKTKKHSIDIVVDRLVMRAGLESRLSGSIDTVSALSGGIITAMLGKEGDGEGETELTFSERFACPDCGVSLEEVEPRMFSFNNPAGACPDCTGLGFQMVFDVDLLIPNKNLSLADGAVNAPGFLSSGKDTSWAGATFRSLAEKYGFDVNAPWKELSDEARNIILYGTDGSKTRVAFTSKDDGQTRYYDASWEGLIPSLTRRHKEAGYDNIRVMYEELMTNVTCPTCGGKRLKPEILAVTVGEKSIFDVTDMPINEIRDFFRSLTLTAHEGIIAAQILKEINARTGFLVEVGLNYLTLSRMAATLSGGESQRIRLATQIGSGLVGVVYILDEPSIGLHQRDNDRLLSSLKNLRDLGNTLIVVEHDEDTMRQADWIVDIGPAAGVHGGEVVYNGTPDGILGVEESVTGRFLSGKEIIPIPSSRRTSADFLTITGARENNLKGISVSVPLGVFTVVTGVSGSGKSSLVNEILYKTLARDLNRAKVRPGKYESMTGIEKLDKVIDIDQSPIGRTPRSNPATYTGLFDLIRDVFAETQEAKIRGYQKGRFSFNVKGGRCEACGGDGIIRIAMNFLPDVYVPCEVCGGKRYNRETLEVKYKGKTIADVLDMTIDEGAEFFANLPKLRDKVNCLRDVGLGYVKLGQSSTTLSGGEAQRVKLAAELSRRGTGRTMYVLDEPTTGLHSSDVRKLLEILMKLTEGGNTVVVIEHNLDVIKTADYIIDLGPEGGDGGGEVIVTGTPEQVAKSRKSETGKYLKKALK